MKIRFLMFVALAFSLFAIAQPAGAQAIGGGYDQFETEIGTQDTLVLPAGLFGPGSQAYTGTIDLIGDPAAGTDFDTEIDRNDSTVGSAATLKMTVLRMKAVDPIVVSYDDGSTEKWAVEETLSSLAPSGGKAVFNADGSFDLDLSINPLINFTYLSGLTANGEEKAGIRKANISIDFGSPIVQGYLQKMARESHERLLSGAGSESDEIIAEICGLNVNSGIGSHILPGLIRLIARGRWARTYGTYIQISGPLAPRNPGPVRRPKVHKVKPKRTKPKPVIKPVEIPQAKQY